MIWRHHSTFSTHLLGPKSYHSAPRHCCLHSHLHGHIWRPGGCRSPRPHSETGWLRHMLSWLENTTSRHICEACCDQTPFQATEHLRHSCSSLMSPQSLSLSHFHMLLMQRPLAQLYWLGKQLCSDWMAEERHWLINHEEVEQRHHDAAVWDVVAPVLMQVLFCSW